MKRYVAEKTRRQIDERPSRAVRTCHVCDGKGTLIDYDRYYGPHSLKKATDVCDNCDGSGEIY